jgi:hypothetical protein
MNHFYIGGNVSRDADATDMMARWARLGDIWIGIWVEAGIEYLFKFELPS